MNQTTARRALTALFLVALIGGITAALPPRTKPRLVVMLTVDQMRGDYLGRFASQWSGGLGRIYRSGAVFPNALQDHALTQTAPGHSTLLSGREPAHTNIVFNDLGVPDTSVRLIGSAGTGASPHRFKGTALADWMQKADTGVRVLSVSRKDRGAILPIGRGKFPVYWYSRGRFTTSTWYADTLPAWVDQWNARGGISRLAGATWNLLLPDSAYPEPDDQPYENHGKDVVFPHQLPSDSAALASRVVDFPWMDSLVLDLALDGVRNLGLGSRSQTDLLAVSLSSTDAVGHDYGPDSRELHDQLLRLDRWLGWFMDSLAATVPGDRTIFILSADHGVTPYAEVQQAKGKSAGFVSLSALVRSVNDQLGVKGLIKTTSGLVYADTAALRERKVNPESLATTLTARVQKLPHVVDAWSAATLPGQSRSNIAAFRWWRSIPRDFPFLVCAVPEPGYVWADASSAEHGSANQDDVNVILAFLGQGIGAGIFPDTVRTVDIAPTLAKLLDLKTPKGLDGRPIKRLTK
jgi:predicted AlkP superfamily pyrophosphatase or phosphodiesterase